MTSGKSACSAKASRPIARSRASAAAVERPARPLADELFQDVVDQRAALGRVGQLCQRLERPQLQDMRA